MGTGGGKGKTKNEQLFKGKMYEMPSSENVSTKLEKIAMRAKKMQGTALTSLSHVIDIEFMKEAYRRVRKDGATGIDKQTAKQFSVNLEENLTAFLDGLKSGSYKAPAVRRVYIPKDGNKLRPLGIPTFADKVMQMAIKMLLEAIYETDFHNSSYGFRPGRSQHHALDAVWDSLKWDGGWVVEIDFESFFDSLSHQHLRSILDARVRDGVVRKMIDKWLSAGIFEDGHRWVHDAGTPQGGIISPLLSNIYLHHVLDEWFEKVVRPRMKKAATLIRFADDAVFVFKNESDAQRFMAVLPKRCEKFGLRLHPNKTRLLRFSQPRGAIPRSVERRASFDFLGFTLYWGKSRKGWWVIKRKTRMSRLRRALSAAWVWCRNNRHKPLLWQFQKLRVKLLGHYRYYGMTGNCRSLAIMRYGTLRAWGYWLRRRGSKHPITWANFYALQDRYPLPQPVVYRSIYPRGANART